MAVRITQQMMYTNYVSNMNRSLAELINLNEQASSQKKVNRPSDAPVAAAQILQYRTQITRTDQYMRNADIAQGWLQQSDSTLTQVNTVLTRVKELAEQAATGTMSAENREQVGYEVRQLFEQLMVLGNTEYEGNHIFAGHKTNQPAFVEDLWATTNDENAISTFSITGDTDSTVMVQFLTSGTAGVDALDYQFSSDGGDTWTTRTLAAGDDTLDLDGVHVTLDVPNTVSAVDTTQQDASILDDGSPNGTWLWIRPTARYQGDIEDNIQVDKFGGNMVTSSSALGSFSQDVMVRIDNTSPITLGEEIEYSYSLDRGITWVEGNTVSDAGSVSNATLPVPGGFLDLGTSAAGSTLSPGDQFIIRPERAEILYEISPNERLSVNNIGKDVFGGIYTDTNSGNQVAAQNGSAKNMFDVVGKLVGYIETNNQSGIQEALDDLSVASEHVMTVAANVGARENRVEVAVNMLENLKIIKTERLSDIEDVDVSELMTEFAMQQIVYESVLKTSSQIMRMSLMNYI